MAPSVFNLIAAAAGLLAGAAAGRRLAARGITAENALKGRQTIGYLVLVAVAAAFALLYFRDRLSLIAWLPVSVLLYAEESVWPIVTALASAALGLLVALEWPGWREPKRLRAMLAGSSVLLLALGYLGWRMQPIEGLVREPSLDGDVVMQTTAYTCAPASIATLARITGIDRGMTERAAVVLAHTTREGTTTLGEMRAMRALGMRPRFARGLSPGDLAAAGRPAILHVDEPVGTTTIRHAVALLGVDTARRVVFIGNPLGGRQVTRFDQLKGYWIGEAVFADVPAAAATAP